MPLMYIRGWECFCLFRRSMKNGLVEAKTVLWTSMFWPSSQARVTSVKSLSSLSALNENVMFSLKSFHWRHSFSEELIIPIILVFCVRSVVSDHWGALSEDGPLTILVNIQSSTDKVLIIWSKAAICEKAGVPTGVVNVIPCRWLWLSSTSSSLSSFFVQCLSQTHSNIIFIFASVWHQTMNFENHQSYQLFIHSWKSFENWFSFETQPREGGRGWEKDVPGAHSTNNHGQNIVLGKKFLSHSMIILSPGSPSFHSFIHWILCGGQKGVSFFQMDLILYVYK